MVKAVKETLILLENDTFLDIKIVNPFILINYCQNKILFF